MTSFIWALQLGSTLYMVGLIWFVQLVHYPLMSSVGEGSYREYQQRHMRWTGVAVGPAMLLEALTSVALLWAKPPAVPLWVVWLGVALLGVVWGSTALLQVPSHQRLLEGFEAKAHRHLVYTNVLRTLAWSARGVLLLAANAGFFSG